MTNAFRTLLVATVFLTAVSTSALCQEQVPPAASGATTQPSAQSLPAGLSPPPQGMGQIVFFRKLNSGAPAVRFKVRENDQELGKLSRGTYFIATVTPGRHTYVVHSEAKDLMDITVREGETRYVVGDVTIGMFVGRPTLIPSNADEFDAVASRLQRTTLQPSGD